MKTYFDYFKKLWFAVPPENPSGLFGPIWFGVTLFGLLVMPGILKLVFLGMLFGVPAVYMLVREN